MREHSYPFPEDDEDFECSQLGFEVDFENGGVRQTEGDVPSRPSLSLLPRSRSGHSSTRFIPHDDEDDDDTSSLGSSRSSPSTPHDYPRPSIRKSMSKMISQLPSPSALLLSPTTTPASSKGSARRSGSSKNKVKNMTDEEKLHLVMKELYLLSD